jgi:hypothetical protein
MPKLTRVLFIIVTVTELGTECFQRMLLQEDMHEVAGMNALILQAI